MQFYEDEQEHSAVAIIFEAEEIPAGLIVMQEILNITNHKGRPTKEMQVWLNNVRRKYVPSNTVQ